MNDKHFIQVGSAAHKNFDITWHEVQNAAEATFKIAGF